MNDMFRLGSEYFWGRTSNKKKIEYFKNSSLGADFEIKKILLKCALWKKLKHQPMTSNSFRYGAFQRVTLK